MDALQLERPPEPNQLLSARRVEAYLADRDRARAYRRLRLRLEVGRARTQACLLRTSYGLSDEDAWASVLLDPMMELSPLFRYCVARLLGGDRLVRVAAKLEAQAALQYERDPAGYDGCLGGAIPRDFASRSRAVYDGLLAGYARAGR